MKKHYEKPQSAVVELRQKCCLLLTSPTQITNATTNLSGGDEIEFLGDDSDYSGDIR